MTLWQQWGFGYRWGWVLVWGAIMLQYLWLADGECAFVSFLFLVHSLVILFRDRDRNWERAT